MTSNHLTDGEQIDFALDDCSPVVLARLQDHLRNCEACRDAVEQVRALLTQAQPERHAEAPARGLVRLLAAVQPPRAPKHRTPAGVGLRFAIAAGLALLLFAAGSWHGRRLVEGAAPAPAGGGRVHAARQPLPAPPRLTIELSAMPRTAGFDDAGADGGPSRPRPDTTHVDSL